MRAILASALIAGAVAASCVVAFAGPSTRVAMYAPFGSSGLNQGYRATSKTHGACWTGSIASQRPDAWRCMVTNSIYDPCFSNPALSSVACPSDAFSKNVILIVLDKPIPAHERNTGKATPWALQLANGARCYMATGATGEVGNMRLNYECSSNGWVLGNPDKSRQPWQVFYSARSDGTHSSRVSVRQAVL
ncbi:MAG: hypothetical protein JO190_10040 [Candidatus Eremiobacteraeota bacterium]|nr:hypothetical protein [Candidatus Eremiobacteraeota bacterium]MBV8497934.1 hypothetical protein [Candidatus Eremiobacteraeota bacterium]